LALIDAGIPLKDYVTACTSGYIHDRVLLDVNNQESSIGGGSELTMAMLPKSGEIVLLEMAQRFHVDHLDKVMEAATKGCKDIHTILDKVVRKHLSKVTASLGQDL
jgi:exosome complex component RRP41